MSLVCKYHQEQDEELGRARAGGKFTVGEAALEQQMLNLEMSRCKECLTK